MTTLRDAAKAHDWALAQAIVAAVDIPRVCVKAMTSHDCPLGHDYPLARLAVHQSDEAHAAYLRHTEAIYLGTDR